MSNSDATPFIFGVAAAAVALWLHSNNSLLTSQLDKCRTNYQGFKEGVLYGR
jgi:hypothetical protein